jgi:hypothetical protein
MKEKQFVVFWERMANSGVLHVKAENAEKAVERVGLNPKFVKVTVVERVTDSKVIECGQAK